MSFLTSQEKKMRKLGVSRNTQDDCYSWHFKRGETERRLGIVDWAEAGRGLGFGRLSKENLRDVEDALLKEYSGVTREELPKHIHALIRGTFVGCVDTQVILWLFTYGITFAVLSKDKGIRAFYGKERNVFEHEESSNGESEWYHHTKVYSGSKRHCWFDEFMEKYPMNKCIEVQRSSFRWLHEDVFPLIQRYWWNKAVDRWNSLQRRRRKREEEMQRRREKEGLAQILHLPTSKKDE